MLQHVIENNEENGYYKVPELAFEKLQDSDKMTSRFFITIFQEEAVKAGAAPITLDAHETGILQKILRSRTLGKILLTRSQIVLAASEHYTNTQIQTQYGIEEHRVATWRNRFYEFHELF